MNAWKNQNSSSSSFNLTLILVLIVAAFELGGIWHELRGIREEQVRNAVYSLNPEIVERLSKEPAVGINSVGYMAQVRLRCQTLLT